MNNHDKSTVDQYSLWNWCSDAAKLIFLAAVLYLILMIIAPVQVP